MKDAVGFYGAHLRRDSLLGRLVGGGPPMVMVDRVYRRKGELSLAQYI